MVAEFWLMTVAHCIAAGSTSLFQADGFHSSNGMSSWLRIAVSYGRDRLSPSNTSGSSVMVALSISASSKLQADIRRIVLHHAIALGGEIYPLSEFTKPRLRASSSVTDCWTGHMLMGIGYTGDRSGYKLLEGDYAMYPYQIAAEVHSRVYPARLACFPSASGSCGRISTLAGVDRWSVSSTWTVSYMQYARGLEQRNMSTHSAHRAQYHHGRLDASLRYQDLPLSRPLGCIRMPQKQHWEGLLQRERTGLSHNFNQIGAANRRTSQ
jgi:hypothetical protein